MTCTGTLLFTLLLVYRQWYLMTCESFIIRITWFTTSKKSAHVELGLNVQNFHWHVFPMPISVSDTHGPFTLRDTHEPIAPDTEITEKNYNLICCSEKIWNLRNNMNSMSLCSMPAQKRYTSRQWTLWGQCK